MTYQGVGPEVATNPEYVKWTESMSRLTAASRAALTPREKMAPAERRSLLPTALIESSIIERYVSFFRRSSGGRGSWLGVVTAEVLPLRPPNAPDPLVFIVQHNRHYVAVVCQQQRAVVADSLVHYNPDKRATVMGLVCRSLGLLGWDVADVEQQPSDSNDCALHAMSHILHATVTRQVLSLFLDIKDAAARCKDGDPNQKKQGGTGESGYNGNNGYNGGGVECEKKDGTDCYIDFDPSTIIEPVIVEQVSLNVQLSPRALAMIDGRLRDVTSAGNQSHRDECMERIRAEVVAAWHTYQAEIVPQSTTRAGELFWAQTTAPTRTHKV